MIFYKTCEVCSDNATWLLMIHGFTHNHTYFEKQINYFKNKYKLLLVDLRGHGKSGNENGSFGVEEYANDIEEVLSSLDINELLIWGTHTGSAISLILALRNKLKINSMILEGTFIPGYHMPRTAELISTAKSIAKKEGAKEALNNWYETADWFNYIREYPLKCRAEDHKAMLSKFTGNPLIADTEPITPRNVSELLKDIKIPCLVYNGKYDLDDFKNAAIHLKNNLSIVKTEVIQEAGGFPGWENPEQVNRVVETFLDSLSH